jgi:hypothetical protein
MANAFGTAMLCCKCCTASHPHNDTNQPPNQLSRFPLAKKRSTDIVGGELCLGFEVMDVLEYTQVGGLRRGLVVVACELMGV